MRILSGSAWGPLKLVFRSLFQPVLWCVGFSIALAVLGCLQRSGWLRSAPGIRPESAERALVSWICPMMCTAPSSEMGRCPVCAMELVAATVPEQSGDGRSIAIEASARRVANIETTEVRSSQAIHEVRASGKLEFDEGARRALAARVDGRIEKLFADYTGVDVRQGDRLAVVYSPRLYSAQVELLLAASRRKTRNQTTAAESSAFDVGLYESSRQRLLELGMSSEQIEELENSGHASSRLDLTAPISGTVIEKLVVEGQYLREGDEVFQLADLSNLWLMLQVFPEEAALVRFGQPVKAVMQSLPGEVFEGRVAFVAPRVDPVTRTVAVRVVISNSRGRLRVGDLASAVIQAVDSGADGKVYDPELARSWLSRRHPQILSKEPGSCSVCGEALISGREVGFTDDPAAAASAVFVPRNAVLMAGSASVVYVETLPGRFELRRVTPGPVAGSNILIREGLKVGERIAVRGNFLIDSQMQLAGNPSLTDPDRRRVIATDTREARIAAALEQLSPEDRVLAAEQQICPVAMMALGSMGPPIRVLVGQRPVLICCEGCRGALLKDPAGCLKNLPQHKPSTSSSSSEAPAAAQLEAGMERDP